METVCGKMGQGIEGMEAIYEIEQKIFLNFLRGCSFPLAHSA
jgi:hypothetical protein